MDSIALAWAAVPRGQGLGINLITFTDTFVSTQLRTALLVLLGAVLFVLLIVSANVANLLLARALRATEGDGRSRGARRQPRPAAPPAARREPRALGARRRGRASRSRVGDRLPGIHVAPEPAAGADIGIDRTVVVFAVAVTLADRHRLWPGAGVAGARSDVNATLKDAGRSSLGGVRPRLRKGLAGAELALATVLLIGAALLVAALLELQRVPLGFDPRDVITFQISLPPTQVRRGEARRFSSRARSTCSKAVPGVRNAGISSGIPFGVGNYTTSPVTAPGTSSLPAGASVPIDWRVASPGYFDTMKIPLLRGRDSPTATPQARPT